MFTNAAISLVPSAAMFQMSSSTSVVVTGPAWAGTIAPINSAGTPQRTSSDHVYVPSLVPPRRDSGRDDPDALHHRGLGTLTTSGAARSCRWGKPVDRSWPWPQEVGRRSIWSNHVTWITIGCAPRGFGMTARPTTVAVVVAGTVGLGIVVAYRRCWPYAAYLTRPDMAALVAGLALIASGSVLLRSRCAGARCLARARRGIHVVHPGARRLRRPHPRHRAALHGAAARRPARPRRRGRRVSPRPWQPRAAHRRHRVRRSPDSGCGRRTRSRSRPRVGCSSWRCCVPGDRLPHAVRTSRAAAGLVLGVGLIVDAVLRLTVGASAESWVSAGHPVEVGLTAVLLAVAGTRAPEWDTIDVSTEGMASLTAVDRRGAARGQTSTSR